MGPQRDFPRVKVDLCSEEKRYWPSPSCSLFPAQSGELGLPCPLPLMYPARLKTVASQLSRHLPPSLMTDPQDPCDKRRELIPASCPLTPTQVLLTLAHPQNKCNFQIFINKLHTYLQQTGLQRPELGQFSHPVSLGKQQSAGHHPFTDV